MKIEGQKFRVLELLAERRLLAMSTQSLGEEVNGGGSKWAAPLCAKYAQMGLVKKDGMGHYQITDAGIEFVRQAHLKNS